MPHAGGGGGGSSGGFHSAGGGSSSHTPRYDHQGHLHSTYYRYPGFYYHSIYIPYFPRRRAVSLWLPSILLSVGAIAVGVGFGWLFSHDQSSMVENCAMSAYSTAYDSKSDSYEYNVCLTLLTYDDQVQYDYYPVVGDELNLKVDGYFGNENTIFGSALLSNLKEGYATDLYTGLASSLAEVNEVITVVKPYYEGNTMSNHILSSYPIETGKEALLTQMDLFQEKTGYCISFFIEDQAKGLKPDWTPFIFMSGAAVLITGFAIFGLIRKKKAYDAFKKEEASGNQAKYFEGEDPYDQYKDMMDRLDKRK